MRQMTAEEAKELWDKAEAAQAKRQQDMPKETHAILIMFEAYQRLMELGWKQAIYCPKDGTVFEVIEAGSTGIFDCHYDGEWPKGIWWTHDGGDLWPSRPILFRLKTPNAPLQPRRRASADVGWKRLLGCVLRDTITPPRKRSCV